MAREKQVSRPIRKSEYAIVFAASGAEKGWRDLVATHRNLMVAAWEFLTTDPLRVTPTNYPLKGELEELKRDGKTYARWQHKPSKGNGARIWFYVDDQKVYLEQVHTNHPKETQ